MVLNMSQWRGRAGASYVVLVAGVMRRVVARAVTVEKIYERGYYAGTRAAVMVIYARQTVPRIVTRGRARPGSGSTHEYVTRNRWNGERDSTGDIVMRENIRNCRSKMRQDGSYKARQEDRRMRWRENDNRLNSRVANRRAKYRWRYGARLRHNNRMSVSRMSERSMCHMRGGCIAMSRREKMREYERR